MTMCNSKAENEAPAFAGLDSMPDTFADPITKKLRELARDPSPAYRKQSDFLGYVSIYTRVCGVESELECEARGENMGPRRPATRDYPAEGGIRIESLWFEGKDLFDLLTERQVGEAEEMLMEQKCDEDENRN